MAKVELKQPIVEEIKASLDGAKGVVLVDHRGLTVEQDTVLFFRVHAWDHGHFQFAVFLQNVARLFGDMVCIALADGGENMLAVLF